MEQEFNGNVYRLYKGERYFSRGRKRLHRVVWEHYNGTIPKGFHIHHKDHNSYNNSIENLELVSSWQHLSGHMTKERRALKAEWVEQIRPLASKWHGSKEGLEWHSKLGKEAWVKRKTYMKNCQVCGKMYLTKFPDRSKFCHQNCKMKALRKRRVVDSS